ncbi:hypothetical protein Trydic_g11398 [Trypoxylus dichotomus]
MSGSLRLKKVAEDRQPQYEGHKNNSHTQTNSAECRKINRMHNFFCAKVRGIFNTLSYSAEPHYILVNTMHASTIIVLYCVSAVITFLQNDYRVVHDHAEIVSVNKSIISSLRLLTVKQNRSYRAYTIYFRTTKNLGGNELKVNIAIDGYLNNLPMLRIAQFDVRICWLFKNKAYGTERLFQTSNLTQCPLKTFQQNDYKLVHDHGELVSYNKSLLSTARFLNVKRNRTYRAYTAYFRTKKDFDGSGFKVNIALDGILNNLPKFRIAQFDLGVCQLLKTKGYGTVRLLQTSNLTQCPINAGYYAIENFNFDDASLPPRIPAGKYRVALTFLDQQYLMSKVYLFVEAVYKVKF